MSRNIVTSCPAFKLLSVALRASNPTVALSAKSINDLCLTMAELACGTTECRKFPLVFNEDFFLLPEQAKALHGLLVLMPEVIGHYVRQGGSELFLRNQNKQLLIFQFSNCVKSRFFVPPGGNCFYLTHASKDIDSDSDSIIDNQMDISMEGKAKKEEKTVEEEAPANEQVLNSEPAEEGPPANEQVVNSEPTSSETSPKARGSRFLRCEKLLKQQKLRRSLAKAPLSTESKSFDSGETSDKDDESDSDGSIHFNQEESQTY